MSKEVKLHHLEDDAEGEEYKVGYGKPPKSRQFKKGQSGNPRGRGRVAQQDYELPIVRQLLEQITAKVGGKKRTITRCDALFYALYEKAMKGDFKSAKFLVEQTGGLEKFRAAYQREKNSADQEVIDAVRKAVDEWTF